MRIPPRTGLLMIVLIFFVLPGQAFGALQYVGGVSAGRIGSTAFGMNVSLTALTGGIGTSAAADDIVIVVLSTGSTANRSIGIISTQGYTEEQELYSNNTIDTNLSVSWKIMGSTPDSTLTTTASGSNSDAISVTVQVWRGVDSLTPFDTAETTNTGTATAQPTPPAILPVTLGAIVIATGAGASTTGAVYTTATLSNFLTKTQVDDNDSMTGMGSFAWSSGTYTPAQFGGGTTDAGDSWAAVTLVLRPARVPTVTTQDATSIGAISATFNGTISNNNGATSTVRGFAWGTSATMVGDTATTTDTAGAPFDTGAFTDSAQTLICNTTYYYRPYAVNIAGTSTAPVSNQFTTSACSAPPAATRTMRLFEGFKIKFISGRIIIHQKK